MITAPISVERTRIRLLPDSSRVLLRPFIPASDARVEKIINRVLSLTDEAVRRLLGEVLDEFAGRHLQTTKLLERHYEKVSAHVPAGCNPDAGRRLLLGAYFTNEYALESAALFNPSIVAHPDQSGLPAGSLRFIMSLRATGEGHISSIEFRGGVIHADNEVVVDPTDRFVNAPELVADPSYEKALFCRKLIEMGIDGATHEVIDHLPPVFTRQHLNRSIESYRLKTPSAEMSHEQRRSIDVIYWLADSNYEIEFLPTLPLSERIIFPVSINERNGIEDARFVRFTDDDGEVIYYATYTAYDGRVILPQILETRDFLHFKVNTLNGKAVQNKGMALFPRKVNGCYTMISRQDNENLFLMYSDNSHFWSETEMLMRPGQPWEFIQLGNCGSPIETEKGWLLLTHGVGAMRKYCIGAILLDLEDPSRIIGRLREPLLKPNANEREGYVPNVVYTCGALVHEGKLIMPYAMSDSMSSVAVVQMDELLMHLLSEGA